MVSSFGLDLSGFRLATFHIREKVLRICVSREGSQNTFFILEHQKEGRPFLNVRVFGLYKYTSTIFLIPSRSLSLTNQPDTWTGGRSSSANNILMI